ncbi:MAG: SusC/RagA family TonB-linked outer membrane protein [Tannerella sp.]|nr:SusC/RagA family TonB-linked outer membrane protein [Tannerella sp.]
MRISAFFFFLSIFTVSATETKSQNASVNIRGNNLTIGDFIEQVEKQTDYLFIYSKSEVNLDERISLDNGKKSVKDCLKEAFVGTNVKHVFENDYIVLTKNTMLSVAQQSTKTISGVVLDESGEPVIGANVVEKGTTNGAITDTDGKFVLNVKKNAILQISYIGYITQETVVKNQSEITITLSEDTQALDEIVVTALGIKRSEKALGYSVQKVGGEELTAVKGANIATSLSGKIAGVTILNKNSFNTSPVIYLRGETPLVVIDGVPFENTNLGQISADDVESLDILKGATASALYGAKGASGAIMITTKRGKKEGLSVHVNSNNMFNLGQLVMPEVQHSYSSGSGGKYLQELSEYIWGDKLDIGRTAVQYDPYTYEWKEMPLVSKGKNNFKNFLQTSFVLNNNVNVTCKGKDGSLRTSFTHIYDRGQYPGNKINKFNYTVAGDIKKGKFSLDASIGYNGSYSPQTRGEGYGWYSYMYNLIVWTGTEFDLREFKDYWVKGKENEEQNWLYKYDYNNPYFLANEASQKAWDNRANGQVTASYELADWLKMTTRAGSDFYSEKYEYITPMSARNSLTGAFSLYNYRGYSFTGDALLIADKKIGDFNVGGMLGAGLNYYQKDVFSANTNSGITAPGFYSLAASIDLPSVSSTVSSRQMNSMYGKIDLSWRSAIFLEVTGRNDWVSTLAKSERSYFYPSASGSIILSELIDMPDWLSFLKIRSSYAITKTPASVYAINKVYSISQNVWNGMSMAQYPTTIRDATILPEKANTFEIGGQIHLLDNRLKLDVAHYSKLLSDIQKSATLSYASGFASALINTDEEYIKKGVEVTLSGDVIRSQDFNWTSSFNWGMDRYLYHQLDDTYSLDRPWVKKGERVDYIEAYDWQRDPEGHIIHSGGMPVKNTFYTKAGNRRADWVWGFASHLACRSFTLDVSIDGRVGGKAHNRLEQAMWNSGTHIDSDNEWRYDQVVNGNTGYVGQGVKVVSGSVSYDSYGNILKDTRVFAPNDVAVTYEAYTKTYHPWNGTVVNQNIKDLTYFKLRELAIGYKLPKPLINKIGLENLHVSLVGQNLFIWTKEFKYSDPDAVYHDNNELLNSPAIRYMGLNLKVNF